MDAQSPQKNSSKELILEINRLHEISDLGSLPLKINDNGYIFRKKQNHHVNIKGEISVYFECMRCSKVLTYDWNSKQIKSPRKKVLSNEHQCSLEQHSSKKSNLRIPSLMIK